MCEGGSFSFLPPVRKPYTHRTDHDVDYPNPEYAVMICCAGSVYSSSTYPTQKTCATMTMQMLRPPLVNMSYCTTASRSYGTDYESICPEICAVDCDVGI